MRLLSHSRVRVLRMLDVASRRRTVQGTTRSRCRIPGTRTHLWRMT